MNKILDHTGLLSLHDYKTDPPFMTTILFWDCECKEGYIHPLTQDECPACCAKRIDQPPSRINEIVAHSRKLPDGLVSVINNMLAALDESPIPF